MFEVLPGAKLTLRSVAVTGGGAWDVLGGGAALVHGNSSLACENSWFTDNKAFAGQGGAIRVQNQASATFQTCTFSTNEAASGDGGAISSYGGLAVWVDGSTFFENSALYSGGAMHFVEVKSILIANSTFTKNTARAGGVVMLAHVGPECVFFACSFKANVAGYGGVVYQDDSRIYILKSKFISNRAHFSEGIFFVGDTDDTRYPDRLPNHRESGMVVLADPSLGNSTDGFLIMSPKQISLNRFVQCESEDAAYVALPDDHPITITPCGLLGKCINRDTLLFPNVFTDCDCSQYSASNDDPTQVSACSIRWSPPIPVTLGTCQTSGGYAIVDSACSFPASIDLNNLEPISFPAVAKCVRASGNTRPAVRRDILVNNGNGGATHWCPTISTYSDTDDTKYLWGFCGLKCGYVDLRNNEDVDTALPPSPILRNGTIRATYLTRKGIEITFANPTNCGGGVTVLTSSPCRDRVKEKTSCKEYFANAGSQDWFCRWMSIKTLMVFPSRKELAKGLTMLKFSHSHGILDLGTKLRNMDDVEVDGWNAFFPSIRLAAPTKLWTCYGGNQTVAELVVDSFVESFVDSSVGQSDESVFTDDSGQFLWEILWVEPSPSRVNDSSYDEKIRLLQSSTATCSSNHAARCNIGKVSRPIRRACISLTVSNSFGMSTSATVIVEFWRGDDASSRSFYVVQTTGPKIVPVIVPHPESLKTFAELRTPAMFDGCSLKPVDDLDAIASFSWSVLGPESITSTALGDVILITEDPSLARFHPTLLSLKASDQNDRGTQYIDVLSRLETSVTLGISRAATIPPKQTTFFTDFVIRISIVPLKCEIIVAKTFIDQKVVFLATGKVTSGRRFVQEQLDFEWSCDGGNKKQPSICAESLSFVDLARPDHSSLVLQNVRAGTPYSISFAAKSGYDVSRSCSISRTFLAESVSMSQPIARIMVQIPRRGIMYDDRDMVGVVTTSTIKINVALEVRTRAVCASHYSNVTWTFTDVSLDRDMTGELDFRNQGIFIAPQSLILEGGRYTLKLMCSGRDPTFQTVSTMIDFVGNRVPYGGKIAVAKALDGGERGWYSSSTVGWVDDDFDLPLTYSFGVISAEFSFAHMLVSPSLSSFWNARLPAFENGAKISVVVRAFDSLGAGSETIESPTILPVVDLDNDDAMMIAALQRWRNDLIYSWRSGVDVAVELSSSNPFSGSAPSPMLSAALRGAKVILVVQSLKLIVNDDEYAGELQAYTIARAVRELIMRNECCSPYTSKILMTTLANVVSTTANLFSQDALHSAFNAAATIMASSETFPDELLLVNCTALDKELSLQSGNIDSNKTAQRRQFLLLLFVREAWDCDMTNPVAHIPAAMPLFVSHMFLLGLVSRSILTGAFPGEQVSFGNLTLGNQYDGLNEGLRVARLLPNSTWVFDTMSDGSSVQVSTVEGRDVWISTYRSKTSFVMNHYVGASHVAGSKFNVVLRGLRLARHVNEASILTINVVDSFNLCVTFTNRQRTLISCVAQTFSNASISQERSCEIAYDDVVRDFRCSCVFEALIGLRRSLQVVSTADDTRLVALQYTPVDPVFPLTLGPTSSTRFPSSTSPTTSPIPLGVPHHVLWHAGSPIAVIVVFLVFVIIIPCFGGLGAYLDNRDASEQRFRQTRLMQFMQSIADKRQMRKYLRKWHGEASQQSLWARPNATPIPLRDAHSADPTRFRRRLILFLSRMIRDRHLYTTFWWYHPRVPRFHRVAAIFTVVFTDSAFCFSLVSRGEPIVFWAAGLTAAVGAAFTVTALLVLGSLLALKTTLKHGNAQGSHSDEDDRKEQRFVPLLRSISDVGKPHLQKSNSYSTHGAAPVPQADDIVLDGGGWLRNDIADPVRLDGSRRRRRATSSSNGSWQQSSVLGLPTGSAAALPSPSGDVKSFEDFWPDTNPAPRATSFGSLPSNISFGDPIESNLGGVAILHPGLNKNDDQNLSSYFEEMAERSLSQGSDGSGEDPIHKRRMQYTSAATMSLPFRQKHRALNSLVYRRSSMSDSKWSLRSLTPTQAKWVKIIPVLILGLVCFAYSAYFSITTFGNATTVSYAHWIESWAVALAFDAIVVQTLLAICKVGVFTWFAIRTKTRQNESKRSMSSSGLNHEGGGIKRSSALLAQEQTRSRRNSSMDSDIFGAVVDVASVGDQDANARDLIDLLFNPVPPPPGPKYNTVARAPYEGSNHGTARASFDASSIDDQRVATSEKEAEDLLQMIMGGGGSNGMFMSNTNIPKNDAEFLAMFQPSSSSAIGPQYREQQHNEGNDRIATV